MPDLLRFTLRHRARITAASLYLALFGLAAVGMQVGHGLGRL